MHRNTIESLAYYSGHSVKKSKKSWGLLVTWTTAIETFACDYNKHPRAPSYMKV